MAWHASLFKKIYRNHEPITNQNFEMMHDCFLEFRQQCLDVLWQMIRQYRKVYEAKEIFFLSFREFRVNVLLTIDLRITHMYWLDIVQLYCTVIIRTMVLSQMMLELGFYIQGVIISCGPEERCLNIFNKVKNLRHRKLSF